MTAQGSHTHRVITACRACGRPELLDILSLGELYVSNFVDADEAPDHRPYPLELVLCDPSRGGCGLLQLRHTVSPELMYRNYWYRSGMNQTMTDELGDIARSCEAARPLAAGDIVVDIGANDGTLLRAYRNPGLVRVGFEPAKNLLAYAQAGTTKIFSDFFSWKLFTEAFGAKRAKVITAIAMFYDLDDPNAFVADIRRTLDPEGLFVIEMHYLPATLAKNAFDAICHEHLEYYSLFSLSNLLRRHDLEIFDAELNDINGGSFRVYVRHRGSPVGIGRPGAAERLHGLVRSERELGLESRAVYEDFTKRVHAFRERLVSFIRSETAQGKKVYVYGASTKGNTLLQFFDLDHRLITAAAERNPAKWGKKTIATAIPIISEAEARAARPDYFLALPWHFLPEFVTREEEFLKAGGKFLVPLPEPKIIGHGSEVRLA